MSVTVETNITDFHLTESERGRPILTYGTSHRHLGSVYSLLLARGEEEGEGFDELFRAFPHDQSLIAQGQQLAQGHAAPNSPAS